MDSFETLARDYAPAGQDAPQAAAPAAEAPKGRRGRKRSPTAKPEPAPAPAAPPPPVFVGGKARSEAIPLDYPVAYAGRTYAEVVLRRPTAGEVGAYLDALAAGGEGLLPVFYAADGSPIPREVLAVLDDDDDVRIWGRVADFLPSRLRALLEATAGANSSPPAGESTGRTSST
ncbi:phage tail assembly protein [Methylobacterium sp. WSM2598]|uniref:phage tail assembly protein n=1 Tax=Methylobacterium sp. WSM2598 TaxID=398261 RepID=UPI00037C3A6B|nr:phage tail assembly protein [Methylobacterium sp. WSM2598]